jgi:hypothetical protein
VPSFAEVEIYNEDQGLKDRLESIEERACSESKSLTTITVKKGDGSLTVAN